MLLSIGPRVGARLRGSALLVALAFAPAPLGCKRGASATQQRPTRSVSVHLKPSPGADSSELEKALPAEVAKARAQQLTPYVEIGAEWCRPCKQLEASMTDARMKEAFDGTYLIRLDVDDWSGALAAFGLEPNVIPVVFEVDAQGKSTGRSIDGNEWGATNAENVAPQLRAFFAKSAKK